MVRVNTGLEGARRAVAAGFVSSLVAKKASVRCRLQLMPVCRVWCCCVCPCRPCVCAASVFTLLALAPASARRFPKERLRFVCVWLCARRQSRLVVDRAAPLFSTECLPLVCLFRPRVVSRVVACQYALASPRNTRFGHRGGIEALACEVCSDAVCKYACASGVSRSMWSEDM